ncbi:metal-dependent hydrolase [Candidatus Woesearchaeota archaeon]|nr:metal-dependent hydrolase [Candidatus Woesearchaeota archaeon]
MIFLTHLLGGVLAVAYFGSFLGIDDSSSVKIAATAVAALFSILPDIDMVKSKAGKHLQPFSTVAAFAFRHRGFLHSFVFAAAVYFGMRYLFSPVIAAAAMVGYSSHLLLDSLTKEGIKPFSPLSKMRIKGFVKTGGVVEKAIAAAMFVLMLLKLA